MTFRIGLYELLITAGVDEQLSDLDERLVDRARLHRAEAANRVALHLGRQIEQAINSVKDEDRVTIATDVVRAVLAQLGQTITDLDLGDEVLTSPASVLRSVSKLRPDGSIQAIPSPLIPLLDTTLLTNAPGEPRVGQQLKAEIESANSIDLLMAFIRMSGIRQLTEALQRHCDDGRSLRVLTTTYTGSTQRQALEQLVDLGAEVRISYDLTSTRLHAKAWLFNRATGFSTAYIGSSNLTHSAQVSGLEWNVRVSGSRNPDVIDKVRAVFESYWQNPDFRAYDPAEFDQEMGHAAGGGPRVYLSPVAITPEPFQERMIEELQVERSHGHHRNLLVSATGTGKTVMAALDYVRLRRELPRARLLFIAHRKEILDQSQATFRHALRDASFGEQWIGGRRPQRFEHVFASVQSLNNADLERLPPDQFDVVIIDEFHHAAARSYERLLTHLNPVELLGLTATPERADGLPILQWFDNRIAVELRLWDAIDQHYLSPFAYYGIHDGVDLRDVPWRRGVGYDVEGLTNLYTANDAWAERVIKEFIEHADEPTSVRALGFCVSVTHALFMARIFSNAGIASVCVHGDTPELERQTALARLRDGELRVLFSVDVFSEGVDLPNVDMIMMLRPTDSATLFLQQLGRGLRRNAGKSVCTVLDFVGLQRREFRFDRRLSALLGGTRKDVAEQVEQGFPYLPAGCHMELDRVASRIVLDSIRTAIPSNWSQRVEELRSLIGAGHTPTLSAYLDHTGLEIAEFYSGRKSWSALCEDAGVQTLSSGPQEVTLRRAIGRLLHADDDLRLSTWHKLLSGPVPTDVGQSLYDGPISRMLISQMIDQVDSNDLPNDASLQDGWTLLRQHPQVTHELLEVIDILRGRIDHVHHALSGRPEVPLQIHARYSRLEVLAAFGHGSGARMATWQAGVLWLPDAKADLFAFTLDKSTGSFSPTTRYQDYAISREMIRWESQSKTRANHDTGLRYQQHKTMGSSIFIFARLREHDRSFWFLGPATYVSHEGERPMAITWRLHVPLPGDLFAQFAAAVA